MVRFSRLRIRPSDHSAPVPDAGMPQTEAVLAEHPPLAGEPVLRLAPSLGFHEVCILYEPRLRPCGRGLHCTARLRGTIDGGTAPEGQRVVRANLRNGEVHNFLASRNPGPGGKGPQRPVDVKFDPSGRTLYVLDFGTLEGVPTGVIPYCGSGILWEGDKVSLKARPDFRKAISAAENGFGPFCGPLESRNPLRLCI